MNTKKEKKQKEKENTKKTMKKEEKEKEKKMNRNYNNSSKNNTTTTTTVITRCGHTIKQPLPVGSVALPAEETELSESPLLLDREEFSLSWNILSRSREASWKSKSEDAVVVVVKVGVDMDVVEIVLQQTGITVIST